MAIEDIEATRNEIRMSNRLCAVPRTNSDVICELAYERREIDGKLRKLKDAIAANPQAVSEHHKDLWKKQAKAMQEYVDVLSERIKDLIDSDD